MFPSPDILNEFEHGKFVLSNLAAKRAKQLREGAIPLVQIESNHPLTIALAEIAAGKIKAILPSPEEMERKPEFALIEDDVISSEFGVLLPALDETEIPLVTEAVLADHEPDIEDEVEVGQEAISLSDLVGDEEEPVPVAAEDDTLSLSDIAERETQLEEGETEE